MPLTSIQNSFVSGEISPSLFGRTDLAKWHNGASTMRNFFANYRGGAASRAGLAYVGTCKQPGTAAPPRDIPFQFSITQGYALEFGDQYMRIKSNGAYVTEATNAITNISQANPGVFTYTNTNYSLANGDWIFVQNVGGMTNFNGLTWIVAGLSGANFHVTDLFGNPVNTTLFNAYTSGGTLARIYTVVAPYAAVDLPYLKYTQSADTMTLCCVNTSTNTEYPSYELERFGATNWTFTQDTFAAAISPPTGVTATPESSTTVSTFYSYVVTAVDSVTGEESVASAPGACENNDIAVFAGSNVVTWNPVTSAGSYNVYKATPSYNVGVPVGVLYGFAGTALGPSFTDTNITADFTTVPPVHTNPFARGAIAGVTPTAGGTSYTQATIGYTITTSTGSGFAGTPVVVGGVFVAFIITNGGQGYANTDTIAITSSGGGSGATASLVIGPQTGTYPSTVAYYQQRRAYASTLNNPDTYYMSQPGAFNNMDASIPVSDSDAIVGTPWAQQVNGVQFLVPMPGGLVVLTGKGAWQLNGGNSAALTPSDQTANPQAYNGCNNIVPPITINYDILYVQAKGSIVRDLSYNFFVNIYTGTDMTVLSNQLFTDHTLLQWAWAEEPYKLVWVVRDDGIMLSLTYLKEQDVYAWTRHDTNGLFVGVCSVTEPPVDAVYVIVKRYVRGQWMYYSERMDDRDWATVEDCVCSDASLGYPMNFPNATLTPAAANGTANISNTNLIAGGSGYVAPVARAVDPTGQGSGATFSVSLSGGAITAVTPLTQGVNYQAGTEIIVTDSAGSGAVVQPIITNNVVFVASSGVFTSGMVGDVVRVGGGKATITAFTSSQQVTANITQAITATVPNDPNSTPIPQTAGNWSISTPTTTVSGLNHLEGLEVAILADGSVVTNQTVVNGSITLPHPYSAITVGLPYTCQLQTLYLDPPGQPTTVQTRRKNIYSVGVRVEATRGLQVGSNQPDASTQPDGATPEWSGLVEIKQRNATVQAGTAIPLATGDEFINIHADWATTGQIAMQQSYPLPANILACVAYFQIGDSAG
jgi:hypothetical protein